jgi:hypothetical protein
MYGLKLELKLETEYIQETALAVKMFLEGNKAYVLHIRTVVRLDIPCSRIYSITSCDTFCAIKDASCR